MRLFVTHLTNCDHKPCSPIVHPPNRCGRYAGMIRTIPKLCIASSLIVLLSACASLPQPTPESPPPAETETPNEPALVPEQPVEQEPAEQAPVDVPEPVPPPVAKPVCPVQKPTACPELPPTTTTLPVVGAVEYIVLDPPNLKLKARMDTGATTSSLDARNIREFERDGKAWVKFEIVDRVTESTYKLERPVVRTVRIKGTDGTQRPVIKLRVRLDHIDQFTEFSLSDRSQFLYPVLIGRSFLRDQAVVDVSRSLTLKAPPLAE